MTYDYYPDELFKDEGIADVYLTAERTGHAERRDSRRIAVLRFVSAYAEAYHAQEARDQIQPRPK